jgi:hypothetical protein
MGPAISLTTTSAEIAVIMKLAREAQGVEDVSEPSALDAGEALKAGLTPEDVKTALEIVTLVFKSAVALLAFLKAIREEMRARRSVVAISDAASGKSLGRIEAGTPDDVLARLAPP